MNQKAQGGEDWRNMSGTQLEVLFSLCQDLAAVSPPDQTGHEPHRLMLLSAYVAFRAFIHISLSVVLIFLLSLLNAIFTLRISVSFMTRGALIQSSLFHSCLSILSSFTSVSRFMKVCINATYPTRVLPQDALGNMPRAKRKINLSL